MSGALRAERLRVALDGAVVLDGVDLAVPPGGRYALLGANGAGKSTLLRCLLGLRRPDDGRATIGGRDAVDPAARRGVVFLPERVLPREALRGEDYLRWFGAAHGLAPPAARRAGAEIAARLGFDPKGFGRPLAALSKGQLQILCLAAALAVDPPWLILDEPFSGLDVPARRRLLAALGERGAGRGLLVSSHDFAGLDAVCDRIGVLHRGRLCCEAPPDAFCARHGAAPGDLESAFLRCIDA